MIRAQILALTSFVPARSISAITPRARLSRAIFSFMNRAIQALF